MVLALSAACSALLFFAAFVYLHLLLILPTFPTIRQQSPVGFLKKEFISLAPSTILFWIAGIIRIVVPVVVFTVWFGIRHISPSPCKKPHISAGLTLSHYDYLNTKNGLWSIKRVLFAMCSFLPPAIFALACCKEPGN